MTNDEDEQTVTHSFGPMRLIANPRAGRGRAGADLGALTAALDAEGLAYDVVETRGPGHAAEAARAALDTGLRYLVAVGGDGTVHEVVNGMVADGAPVAADAVLGVFGAGSGCDFVRTFGLDRSAQVVARHLASEAVMPIDLGLLRYADARGRPSQRVFANIANIGYGADAVHRANRLPRRLGRLRYLLGAWWAIPAQRQQETTIELEDPAQRLLQGGGVRTRTVPLVNLVVANGQFFGGGMKVAPRALPDDGLYNVQAFWGQRSQMFVLTQKLYSGEHLPNPHIAEFQSPIVRLEPAHPMRVEADGEVLGQTPAELQVLSRVLQLKI